MRNFKRTLALVLAVIMIVGTFATVSAAPATAKWYDVAVKALDKAGISSIGNSAAEPLSRNEFVMWIAKIESLQLSEDAWNDEIASVVFTDVTDAHHKAAIAYSYKANFIIGNGDGTFAPDKQLSLAEASAVIVRLMRYESKVTGLAEEWDMNYMRAAAIYCNAFDQTFYKNSNTFDPDYPLTKGETAYILATILNFVKDGSYNETIKTADGIDLGARFEGMSAPAQENVYYIRTLERKYAVSNNNSGVAANGVTTGNKVNQYTNEINKAKEVVLASADGSIIRVPGAEFVKALRVSLGMNPEPVIGMEEAEINVYEYINVGTLVNIKLDETLANVPGEKVVTSYKQIKTFEINNNSVVVDTVLQYSLVDDPNNLYVGYAAVANGKNENITSYKPVLNPAYDATMSTSWTNLDYGDNGALASATLNFKGVAYKYELDANGDPVDFIVYGPDWNPMTVDNAVKNLINVAQGEMYAVFNDVDADGIYDSVYVKESYPFAFANEANVQPTGPKADNAASAKYQFDILTSVSDGEVMYKDAYLAYNNAGSVIFNREVTYPNDGRQMSSDSYALKVAETGKLQLVLCAYNARPVRSAANCVPLYYEVVDLASFYTGIIQEVSAEQVAGFYTARILCTDDMIRTVYIPVNASPKTELDVTVAGSTATYTFDSNGWYTFLKDTQKAAEDYGISKKENQIDPEYINWAASWMAGKYVEFAINENNEAICILGTDNSTGKSGFVTDVEKTATGDNTYNVTIATTTQVDVGISDIKYFNATNPITETRIKDWTGVNIDKRSGETVVIDGQTYYQVGDEKLLWASTETNNADTYFVCINNAEVCVDANGNYTDTKGNVFYDLVTYETRNLVSGVTTAEVRAAASGIFDWNNYNVYNQLFKGSLIDPNTKANDRVSAGEDLIYVTLMQDAGSNYVLYNAGSKPELGDPARKVQFGINGQNWAYRVRWYQLNAKFIADARHSWYNIEEGYFLSLEEIAGSRDKTFDKYGNENGYTALYNAKVGFDPYYARTLDDTTKTYTYDLKFGKVVEYKEFEGTATAVVDTTKTYMIPLYENQADDSSNQVIADTEAKKNYFTINNGYYVDDAGKVFILVAAGNFQTKVVYKTNEDGTLVYNPVVYDYNDAKHTVEVGTNVSFKDKATLGLDKELTPYAVLTLTAKTNKDEGYFPGAHYLNLDGKKYNVNVNTQFVVVTPSADGFDISVKTLAEMAAADPFFVTEWSAVIGTGNTIAAIAIVGEKATSGSSASDPETPIENNEILVYLDKDAKAFIRHDKYSNEWLVVSDKTAYALPTGEEVGAIYRSYPTYAEADNAIKINLGITGGEWYIVDETGKIVNKDAGFKLLTGKVTDVDANGTTIATLNGVENIVISDMKTEFFYFDTNEKLNIAGDSTNVSIIAKGAFMDLFKTLQDELDAAQKAYDEATKRYEDGILYEEKYVIYKENLENAKKALADAKANNLDKYFNGQFWGFANSPLYKYVVMAQGTFQEEDPTLFFKYVIVDDTLCVFSDKFAFTQAEADAMN